MKRFLDKDLIAGLLLIALGIAYYRMAEALPRSLISDRVGAAGFPKLLASALIIFAVVLIVQGFVRNRALPAGEPAAVEGERTGRPWLEFGQAAGMLSLGIGYLLIVSRVGYLLSITLLLAAALRYQREPFSPKVFLTAILGGIFFWVFFVHALNTPMPAGIWPTLLAGR